MVEAFALLLVGLQTVTSAALVDGPAFCEIVETPEDYLGQTVTTSARLRLSSHGSFADHPHCDGTYLRAAPDLEVDGAEEKFFSSARMVGHKADLVVITARIEMAEFDRPLAPSEMQPRLVVLDVQTGGRPQ